MLLALLTVSVAEPLARLVAARNVASAGQRGRRVGFALFGPVRWAAAPLAAGFLIGGTLGPGLVRRLPGDRLWSGSPARARPGRQAKFDTFGQVGGRRDSRPVTERALSTRQLNRALLARQRCPSVRTSPRRPPSNRSPGSRPSTPSPYVGLWSRLRDSAASS